MKYVRERGTYTRMSYLSIKSTNGRKSDGFLGHGDLPHTRNW